MRARDPVRRNSSASIAEQLLRRHVKRFRGGLVSQAHVRLLHLTLDWKVIKKKEQVTLGIPATPAGSINSLPTCLQVDPRNHQVNERGVQIPHNAQRDPCKTPIHSSMWCLHSPHQPRGIPAFPHTVTPPPGMPHHSHIHPPLDCLEM